MIRLLMFVMISSLTLIQQGSWTIQERLIHDETLIAPGIGAEKIILHESVAKLSETYQGLEYRTAKVKDDHDIFHDILKINVNLGLKCNEIRYFYGNSTVVFIKNNIVQSIAGLNPERITVDSVDLAQGASYFLLNYGNESLKIIKESNGQAYIYPTKGIAVLDDNNDDSIDLYLVFPPLKQ